MKIQQLKTYKELISWILVFGWALLGFFLFLKKSPPEAIAPATATISLFHSALSFFATVGLAAFFLLIRFFIRFNKTFPLTRLRHIAGATMLSVGGIISWEFSQMFLLTRPFNYNVLLGTTGGAVMVICCWSLSKIFPKKLINN